MRLDLKETQDQRDPQAKWGRRETKELLVLMEFLELMVPLAHQVLKDKLDQKEQLDLLEPREMLAQLAHQAHQAHQVKLNLSHLILSVHQRLLQEEREIWMTTTKLLKMIFMLESTT